MSGHTLILPAVERRRPILRGRLRRRDRAGATAGDELVEIEPSELTRIFAAPGWLRDLGFSAWLLVGVAAAVAGAVWFLSLTQTIVVPVITAAIIASVASPVVDWLKKHSVPRGAGAAIVFVAIIAIGVAVGVIVLAGIKEHDIKEVAALLDLPEGTVKSRLFAARQQLKDACSWMADTWPKA